MRVSDSVPRATRRQDHSVLRQRVCSEELRTEATEVSHPLYTVFLCDLIISPPQAERVRKNSKTLSLLTCVVS